MNTPQRNHRSRPSLLAIALLTGLGLNSVGCGDGGEPGSLVVPFRLGIDLDCEEAGVERVRASLDGDLYVETADCEDAEVRFDRIEADKYSLFVEGLDSSGVTVMDNGADELPTVEVLGDDTTVTADEIRLTASPAHLLVRWGFEFIACADASIESFAIEAFDEDGQKDLLTTRIKCEEMASDGDGYRVVPDEDRLLDGEQLGRVRVQAQDKDGVDVGDAAIFEFAPPGPGYTVKLTLNCESNGCSGSGTPD